MVPIVLVGYSIPTRPPDRVSSLYDLIGSHICPAYYALLQIFDIRLWVGRLAEYSPTPRISCPCPFRSCSNRPRCNPCRAGWSGGMRWSAVASPPRSYSTVSFAVYQATGGGDLGPAPVPFPNRTAAAFSIAPWPLYSLAAWLTPPPPLSSLPLPPPSGTQPSNTTPESGST